VKDTARNRVSAAKVCEKLGRLSDAQTHVEAALKLEPEGYLSNLAAYVVALKRSTDLDSAETAFDFLGKLQEKYPPDALTNDQRIEMSLAMGIGAVLLDEPAAARKQFESVLKGDKDNETARQALAMLAGR
jgi:Tfp pilus assembly protein PilF